MIVLGIESSCDETACSVVRNGKEILSNVVTSQIDLHQEFGGVVPELASRRHAEVMIPVIDMALKQAGVTLKDVGLIAVAQGPGLVGALMIGLNTAKALSMALGIPFVGVNHIYAHLYAALMDQPQVHFPCLGVVLSGGHTALLQMQDLQTYIPLGRTVDDAIGEAFDKVAKLLGLPYPGGPYIEELAKQGDPFSYPFKAGRLKDRPLDFSFSGLKTAVLYAIQEKMKTDRGLSQQDKCNVSASFQRAAFQDVIQKSLLGTKSLPLPACSTLVFGGGVTNSRTLRNMFTEAAPDLKLIWPAHELTLDNAAMIAGYGYHVYLKQGASGLTEEVYPSL